MHSMLEYSQCYLHLFKSSDGQTLQSYRPKHIAVENASLLHTNHISLKRRRSAMLPSTARIFLGHQISSKLMGASNNVLQRRARSSMNMLCPFALLFQTPLRIITSPQIPHYLHRPFHPQHLHAESPPMKPHETFSLSRTEHISSHSRRLQAHQPS